MKKKIKLFEPIRRGAPNLPFDFMEKLKKMEIIFSYPKKIDENRYEIATGMYCNKNGLNDYLKNGKEHLDKRRNTVLIISRKM